MIIFEIERCFIINLQKFRYRYASSSSIVKTIIRLHLFQVANGRRTIQVPGPYKTHGIGFSDSHGFCIGIEVQLLKEVELLVAYYLSAVIRVERHGNIHPNRLLESRCWLLTLL